MRAHGVVLLSLLAACGDDAPRGGVRSDAVRVAMDCLRAHRRADAGALQDYVKTTVDGCSAIYREPACRVAWTKDGSAGPEVAEACRVAYCPRLPAPKPALCTDPSIDAMHGWNELHLAIVAFELGPVLGRSLADAIAHPEADVPLPAIPAGTPMRIGHEVSLRVDAVGVRRGQELLATHDQLAAGSTAVADALTATIATQVILTVDGDLPYAQIIGVMNAIQAAGIHDIQLETSP